MALEESKRKLSLSSQSKTPKALKNQESTSTDDADYLSCYICKTVTHFEQLGMTKREVLVITTNASIGVTWVCQNCNGKSDKLESLNMEVQNLKSTMDSKIQSLTESMQNEVQSLFETLTSTFKTELESYRKLFTNNGEETQSTTGGQPSHILSQPENNVKHTLLVQPKNDKEHFTKESWSDIVSKCISEKLNKVPVNKTMLTSKGMGYMVFPNKESRNTAAKTLEPDCKITIQDKNTKSVYPKLKIHGIPKEQFDKKNTAVLREELIRKNEFISKYVNEMNKIFQIIFISDNKDTNFSSAILRVDPDIKNAIQGNGNRVFLGLSSCRVTNQYHILQCYTCQAFGHKVGSEKCTLKNSQSSICLYCAEQHISKNCPSKKNSDKHRCANCTKSDNSNSASSNYAHPSNSVQCPLLQNELKALLNRTMGCTNNETIAKNEIST